jgi:hypothetical protein
MHNISLIFVPNNAVSVGAPLPTKPVFAGTCFLFVPWKFSLPYFKWNFEIPNFSFKSGLEFSENVSLNTKQSSHIDTVAPSGTFEQFASLYIFSSVLIPWFSVSWLVKQRSEFVFLKIWSLWFWLIYWNLRSCTLNFTNSMRIFGTPTYVILAV